MKIIRYPHHRPLSSDTCVTVGNFDGVHIGHQALIKKVVEEAQIRRCLSVVVTMNPLPIQYFSGRDALDILTSFKSKASLVAAMGVDVLCVLNFNHHLSQMSAKDFFNKILVGGLRAQYILVGDDFRFGKNRQGGFNQLLQWSQQLGLQTKSLDSIQKYQKRVSSTHIRKLLKDGNFNQSAQMLGRSFNLCGRVAHGRKKGRELGYPTINIELKRGGFPLHGVYVTHVRIEGSVYQSVTSVGLNPTVGGNAKRVEVHVLDFNREVYGQTVEVLFYKKLRNEVEFDSLNELIGAIEQDVIAGREFFASYKGELV
ncbi:bifunctional riboflavin kinase/FAD synthetase [Marinicella litoralis]|uniref:Riboflavin biosynthesis protein n=1 Tax=Marinicella litoralis TaxID=644220 RepID=A0A4R6XJA4_9GAMM|nr:bifunctional riboflavin kinase/FAD synthetase [Marinicella litoralis]TDR18429.1 FMN adenylyltransferase /riboflavin kinase [Marinicella litoralis]